MAQRTDFCISKDKIMGRIFQIIFASIMMFTGFIFVFGPHVWWWYNPSATSAEVLREFWIAFLCGSIALFCSGIVFRNLDERKKK